MSELTKQQLKNELVSHGVELPAATAKKSEYVKIYEKYVAPVSQSRGDFSSDDEDLPVNDVKAQVSLDTSQLVINGLEINHLDDDDLYARLKDLGSPVGPIVDTTRSVYQKKLFVLMGGRVPESPATFNGNVDQEEEEEEYSDSEPEVAEAPVERRDRGDAFTDPNTLTSPSNGANAALSSETFNYTQARRRVVAPSESGRVFDPDLHTPSPRRSLRTVTSSETSTTYHRTVNNGKTNARFVTSEGRDVMDGSAAGPGKVSSALRVLVKLLFLALIIAAALYFYQNNPSESPFKAIEEMARQALEAASGEQVTTTHDDTDKHTPPPPPPQQPEVTN